MTDVSIGAPPGSPPHSPPHSPPISEVAINPNPTQTPQPIGSQAPSKPVGDLPGSPHHPESRRETIRKAFQRASEPAAARPRMGHNNPPEPMQKERSAPPQRQGAQAEPAAGRQPREQARGEHGRFARADQQPQPGQPQPLP